MDYLEIVYKGPERRNSIKRFIVSDNVIIVEEKLKKDMNEVFLSHVEVMTDEGTKILKKSRIYSIERFGQSDRERKSLALAKGIQNDADTRR